MHIAITLSRDVFGTVLFARVREGLLLGMASATEQASRAHGNGR